MDFVDEIIKFRNMFQISQEDFAKEIGISRIKLTRIEQREFTLDDDLVERIEYVIETYKKENSLYAMIDYIRVSVDSIDPQFVCERYLNMNFKFFQTEVGMYSYLARYEFGNIKIFEPKPLSGMGCMIEMSGQGCRYFERILEEQGMTLINWLSFIKPYATNFPRIDLAIDYIEYFSLEKLHEKVKRGEYLSDFKTVTPKFEYSDENRKNSDGLTLYFGKRESLCHFCFYQKNYEIAKRERIPLEEIEVKNRYEVRLTDEYANDIVEHLVGYDEVLPVAMGVIAKKLVVVQRLKKRLDRKTLRATYKKGKIKMWKPWKEMFFDVHEIRMKPKEMENDYMKLIRKENYLKKQAMASVVLMQDIDKALGTTVVDDIVKNIRENPNPRNERLFKVATTTLKDMIFNSGGFGYEQDKESEVY